LGRDALNLVKYVDDQTHYSLGTLGVVQNVRRFGMDETITIPLFEYNELKADSVFLSCLEMNGVDNWDGYEIAQDQYRDLYPDED